MPAAGATVTVGTTSTDEAAERDGGADRRVCSLGTAVTLLTLVSIYTANAISKYRSDTWMSGGAVPQIFQLEEFIVRLGPFVSEHTVVLATINWLWIALLSASVLLIATTGWLRAGIALAFVSAHLGMAATMRLGVFPFIMITILLLCFPTGVWNLVEAVTSKLHGSSRPTERAYRSDGGSANESASPIPSPSRVRRVIWTGAALLLVGFFLALVWWQAAGVGLVDLPASESAGELSEVSWSFFAPNPPDSSSWYVVRGRSLESGESIDVRGGQAATYDRPPDAAETYPTTLWHQFGFRMRYAGESRYRPVAAYVCERSDRSLESVTVFHVEQAVDPNGPVGSLRRTSGSAPPADIGGTPLRVARSDDVRAENRNLRTGRALRARAYLGPDRPDRISGGGVSCGTCPIQHTSSASSAAFETGATPDSASVARLTAFAVREAPPSCSTSGSTTSRRTTPITTRRGRERVQDADP